MISLMQSLPGSIQSDKAPDSSASTRLSADAKVTIAIVVPICVVASIMLFFTFLRLARRRSLEVSTTIYQKERDIIDWSHTHPAEASGKWLVELPQAPVSELVGSHLAHELEAKERSLESEDKRPRHLT
jgi:hypothetical protein